ncbi:MAG TPA: RNA polymerase sigma factor [Burkholderiales bacterium]|nr:RNA polymerase sigma factor [Burkholderiales bacterium]
MSDSIHSIGTHIPRLRRYARALTGDAESADDLVQDTVERALVKFALWQQGTDLRAWLFTIMHNLFVNQLRLRRTDVTGDDIEDIPVRGGETDHLEVSDLDSALQRLPGEQREVLLLVALEQLSYQETATLLEIPIGTVMSRLSRARARLRAVLARSGEGGTPLKRVK